MGSARMAGLISRRRRAVATALFIPKVSWVASNWRLRLAGVK